MNPAHYEKCMNYSQYNTKNNTDNNKNGPMQKERD